MQNGKLAKDLDLTHISGNSTTFGNRLNLLHTIRFEKSKMMTKKFQDLTQCTG